jgi:hypothetical protein
MADKVTWKQKLKGAFDLVFLFGRGIEPFEKQNNKSDALKSLWIPVVIFPLGLISAWLWPPPELVTLPKTTMLLTVTAEGIAGTIASFGIIWLAAVSLGKKDRFWVAFQAFNWIAVPLSMITTPFLFLALMEWYPREVMDRIFTVTLYYGILVSACVLYRGLRIFWEFAGFFVCVGVFAGQMIQNIGCWINGVPIR